MKFTGINKILRSEALEIMKERRGKDTFKTLLRDWKWIFGYSRRNKKQVLLYTLIGIIASSASLLISYSWKLLINDAVASEYGNLIVFSIMMIASIVCSIAANAVYMRLAEKIIIRVYGDIRADIFGKLLDAKWSDIASYEVGDIVNRLSADIKIISENAVAWIPDLIVNIYTFIFTFILLWRTDIVMALISVAAAPLIMLISGHYIKKIRQSKKDVMKLSSEIRSFETDAFSNYDMIKSFGISDFYNGRLSLWQDKFKERDLEYNKTEISAKTAISATSWAITAAAFGYCILGLISGRLPFGDMTFFLSQRNNVSARLRAIVNAFPGLISSAVAAERVKELYDLEPEEHNSELSESADIKGGISVFLSDISFAYKSGAYIIEGGDFEAHPGSISALIGPSGEGKTTLLRMILGIISPMRGKAYLKSGDNEFTPCADTRRLISYVPQGSAVIPGSIAENLRMVKEDASDGEIISALKKACAYDFVENMPGGINAVIGAGGFGISAGQAQRIAIARAILRDSPILILDEATSALDAETERKVLDNILISSPDKTCIVSTHRAGIISQCGSIYRIDKKKIIKMSANEALIYFNI